MGAVTETYEGRVRQVARYESWDEDLGEVVFSRVAVITYAKEDGPEQTYRVSGEIGELKAGDAVWVKVSVERKGE